MSAREAIAFYLASAAYIHAEFPRLHPLPAFCHVHLHHARFSVVSFQRELPTHFGIADRFKNIFHDNNSCDCEKLIPKTPSHTSGRMAVEYREKIFPVQPKTFSHCIHRLHDCTCTLKYY